MPPKRPPADRIFNKRNTPAMFAEASLPGPTRRASLKVYAPTARIGRILAKELGLPVALFWQHAAKVMLERVSEMRRIHGDEPFPDPEVFFSKEADSIKYTRGMYGKNFNELVAAAAQALREGRDPE